VAGTWPNFTISATGSGGSVTSIVAGTNMTGGTITSSGTLGVSSTPVFSTVDATGTSTLTPVSGHLQFNGIASLPSLGANGEGYCQLSSSQGLTCGGQGSTGDFTLYNKSNTLVCEILDSANTWQCNGITTTNNLVAQNSFAADNIKNNHNSSVKNEDGTAITVAGTGLGTSPSVAHQNGSLSGFITAGTSPANATFNIILGVSPNYAWGCFVNDISSNSTIVIGMTAKSGSTVTMQGYLRSNGTTTALNASDELFYMCGGS
jgi:hypothetical protein